MSDDFLRLVSQANPAANTKQYQPANGYPPAAQYADNSNSSPMDPFFDDDDDNVPDSAFGRSLPMQSQESGFPLTRAAVPPAGSGPSKTSLGDGIPQGWNFDDDDFQPSNSFPGPSTNSIPATTSHSSRKRRGRWKWPWQKDKVLTGERIISLNNPDANFEYCSNFVSTSKYNVVTFIPKFLAGEFGLASACRSSPSLSEQFSKYANIFFLFTACIQQIPDVSPTNKYTTILPLGFVLLASAFKEVQEDLVRPHSYYLHDLTRFRNDTSLMQS